MATESDLIRRYRGAFSSDECDEIISHIDFLNKNNLMFYKKESLHNQDHISSNLSHDWILDLPAYSRISELIIPKFKPCVDEYLQAFYSPTAAKLAIKATRFRINIIFLHNQAKNFTGDWSEREVRLQ